MFSGGIARSFGGVKLRPALLHWLAPALLSAGLEHARAAAPVVSNVRSEQRAGTQLVDIDYDLADPDSATLAVTVTVSTNGGATYDFPATSFSGALGNSASPGAGRRWKGNSQLTFPSLSGSLFSI